MPDADFTFAFQPILDLDRDRVFAYEALLRGAAGESAGEVLSRYRGEQLHRFDRDARREAVRLAAQLGLHEGLSLNFIPQTLDTLPDAISSTIDAAVDCGLSAGQLIFEVTEQAMIEEPRRLAEYANRYRPQGVRFAIDDFGAGFAGLNLLAEFQPDIVKIDMQLVRHIDSKGPRQAIARALIQVCAELGLDVVAEGVESEAEQRWFARRGVCLYQGYWIARPALGRLVRPRLTASSHQPSANAVC